ncbi:MAG: ABC transporter ATP-binding protein [Bacilli bacterium]|nr:ABC transporter ATP-binding protein [Bacilli bacterium]
MKKNNNKVMIELKNIRKIFRYFKKDYMVFYWLFTRKGFTKEFKVLDNISFTVRKGEVVGILGKNGAGKSTILKIISGIYFPTSGKVNVNGTITSLIELGAGFKRELTGRENLYFKGSLLGLSKEYLDKHVDQIIEFADIGEYIDMPLGTYSSGMSARLGFALAVNADPDILIIDEVFAVGDKNFQQKSRAKTEEMLKSGKTVLFVSHSEALISEFCNRVIYLKAGKVVYDGPVRKGLAIYHADNLNLEKVPLVTFNEYELNENMLRLRFNYGLGANEQVFINDNYDDFELILTHFSTDDSVVFEDETLPFTTEKVSDDILDCMINIVDIKDGGYFAFKYHHKNMENELYNQVIFVEQNIKDDYEDEQLQVDIKDDNHLLSFKVDTLKEKASNFD